MINDISDMCNVLHLHNTSHLRRVDVIIVCSTAGLNIELRPFTTFSEVFYYIMSLKFVHSFVQKR